MRAQKQEWWREDDRRVSNGDQVSRVASLRWGLSTPQERRNVALALP
jgi:hypothetical protein